MMKEIFGLADDPPARRRWFHDEYFDLFVWQTAGEVTLFQLCYGAGSAERALVWDKSRGLFHDGRHEENEGAADFVTRFEDAAESLPHDIRREVREKVHEFAGRRLAVRNRRAKFRREAWQAK